MLCILQLLLLLLQCQCLCVVASIASYDCRSSVGESFRDNSCIRSHPGDEIEAIGCVPMRVWLDAQTFRQSERGRELKLSAATLVCHRASLVLLRRVCGLES